MRERALRIALFAGIGDLGGDARGDLKRPPARGEIAACRIGGGIIAGQLNEVGRLEIAQRASKQRGERGIEQTARRRDVGLRQMGVDDFQLCLRCAAGPRLDGSGILGRAQIAGFE